MSLSTHIEGVYHFTASLRVQSWYIRKYGKRVAKLKAKIHHQHNPKRRERLEKKYKKQASKLNGALHEFERYKKDLDHHLASLKTEY